MKFRCACRTIRSQGLETGKGIGDARTVYDRGQNRWLANMGPDHGNEDTVVTGDLL